MLTTRVALAAVLGALIGVARGGEEQKVTALQPAQLRTLTRHLPATTYYPEFALTRHLQGRLLIEFHLDETGYPVAARIIKSDADAILQATALRLVQGTRYDLGSFDIDPGTVFHTTVMYCLDHCAEDVDYAGADTVVQISGSEAPTRYARR